MDFEGKIDETYFNRVHACKNKIYIVLYHFVDITLISNTFQISGLGAGMDSFYEYLLKSYVLFEEKSDLEKFLNVYKAIKSFMRRGRRHCNQGFGPHPFYVNVNMESGDTFTQWTDSLQAAMPGLQVK